MNGLINERYLRECKCPRGCVMKNVEYLHGNDVRKRFEKFIAISVH